MRKSGSCTSRGPAMPRLFACCLACAVYALASLLLTQQVGADATQDLPRAPREGVCEGSCGACHTNSAGLRIPDQKALMTLPPEAIYKQLTTGVMVVQAQKLADADKRAVSEYLGGRPLDLN